MKRKPALAIISALIIVLSFTLASCTSLFQQPTDPSNNTDNYDQQIKLLESQILLLMQTHQLSTKEYENEVKRLQEEIDLLKELSADLPDNDEDKETESEDETDSGSEKDNETQYLFTYITEGKNAIITGYSGEDETLAIPKIIDGYTVTEIADSSISSSEVKNIIVPESVTKIGWFAFNNCPKLKNITLPSSVTSIGYSAFNTSNRALVIYCQSNSFAQEYAKSYGLSYVII